MITQKQRIEWTENPVTGELLAWVREELKDTIENLGLDAFQPFQPERTQEILANLNGIRATLEQVEERLSKEFYEDE